MSTADVRSWNFRQDDQKTNRKYGISLHDKPKDGQKMVRPLGLFAKSSIERKELEKRLKLKTFDPSTVKVFSDFPISERTCEGLACASFLFPTEIQRESLHFALQGLDILGAAKTGSGKTLAFIIPILEVLYRNNWNSLDGLAALVVTPVRELAYQIFDVLCKVGSKHDFSAGLLIGGQQVEYEKKRVEKCHIVICTPGRLLQHMDENPLFDVLSLKIFVLDEADRLLNMGFANTLNAIIENLPPDRQTLLFSATQTKSVKDLARLSLRDPVYVSVHEHAKYSTPELLKQSYVVGELHDKIGFLWSFLKYHKQQKVIVFVNSCKEVRFLCKAFSTLLLPTTLIPLSGRIRQKSRMNIYDEFCSKSTAVLIATDIAARGLDFPAVHWVIQANCPIDANEYIHRVGRTARYKKNGESLLYLLPSEEKGMIAALTAKKIPINKIKMNPKNMYPIHGKLSSLLARDVKLKGFAQGAFVSYMKSVYLMKNKVIFDVTKLDTEAYANNKTQRNDSQKYAEQSRENVLNWPIDEKVDRDTVVEPDYSKYTQAQRKLLKYAQQSVEDMLNESINEKVERNTHGQEDVDDDSDSDEELFRVRRRIMPEDVSEDEDPAPEETSRRKFKKVITKLDVANKILKKKIVPNMKLVFDNDGNVVLDGAKVRLSAAALVIADNYEGGLDIEAAKLIMEEEDEKDKEVFKQFVRAKRRERRNREREREREAARLERAQDDDDDGDDHHYENEYREARLGCKGEGGGGDDDDDDNNISLNLDFLPDPDKFYGPENSDSDADESTDVRDEPKETGNEKRKRKKKEVEENVTKSKKKRSQDVEEEEEEALDTGLQLGEDEELALHLLNL